MIHGAKHRTCPATTAVKVGRTGAHDTCRKLYDTKAFNRMGGYARRALNDVDRERAHGRGGGGKVQGTTYTKGK